MMTIPNLLCLLRIGLSLALLATEPLGALFTILYLICGLSDAVDGFIARKTGTATALGARLDSIADFIMIAVLIALLYPIINPSPAILVWVGLIVVVRMASVAVAFVKYRCFAMLHTYGNKATGFLLFVFPLALPFVAPTIPVYVLCAAASLSAIEELLIQLSSKELQLNRKSLWTLHH